MSTINFEKAINYIKSLPAIPDFALTPDIIIKWDKTKTTKTEWGKKRVDKTPVFYYPKTGVVEILEKNPLLYKHNYLFDTEEDKRAPYLSNNKDSVTSAKTEIFSYYGKYHKEIDALEIASIQMSGKRAKDGEKRVWEYVNINNERYFLFRNGEAIKGFSYLLKDGKYYDKTLLHWLQSDLHQNIHNKYFDGQALIFFGYKAQEEYSSRETFWIPFRVTRWYEKIVERPIKKGSVKEILINTQELTEYSNEYLFSLFKGDNKGSICTAFKGGVLIRYFANLISRSIPFYRENYRVFFSEKEIFILKFSQGKWNLCSVKNCYIICSYKDIVGKEQLENIKRIKQVIDVATSDKFAKDNFIQNLIYILKYPIIEKVYKSGYPTIAKKINSSPVACLRDYFDTTPKKTGSVYQNLGINKFQLKVLEKHFENCTYLTHPVFPKIKFVKEIGGEDVIHWDEKKSQKIFTFASMAGGWQGLALRTNYLNSPTYIEWGNLNSFYPTDEDKRRIRNLINLQAKNPDTDCVRLFRDTIYLICNSVHEILPNMNPFEARTLRDLNWMHDQYVNIANAKKFNRLTKDGRWDKLNEKRIKLYERIGDDFEIIVPREPKDIMNEGAALSHCVGSYVESVASGYKTILFLRRVSDPEKSFYTIEVNDISVIQIHGNHNKWLGNNPEAIQFVIDWLKDVKIHCPLNILFNLGQGYCGSKECLDHSGYKLNEYVDV